MSSKRRSAAAASPDVRTRTKRRKVSEDDLMEISSRASSHTDSEEDEAPEAQESEVDFEGDNLQSAQDKIMSELTRLQDDDGQEVAYPFIGKPDRALYRDYYELIQHPVSLRSIQKKVRGTDSRKNTSKTTAYPTWQSFEEEVSFIWRNAREYNEDDSEISALAGILEGYFAQRVGEAKKLVPDSHVDGMLGMPRIKLKIGTSVPPIAGGSIPSMPTLGSNTIMQTNDQSPDGIADREPSGPHQRTPRGLAPQNAGTSPQAQSVGKLDNSRLVIATESTSEQLSPSLSAWGLSDLVRDEPPTSTSTSQAPSHANPGAFATDAHPFSPPNNPSCQHHTGPSMMDSILRQSGQDASMALIRNVRVATHASLSLKPDFCLDIPPSSLVSQQTVTIHLPSSHNLLTLKPRLAASTSHRQVKVVALTGMQRLHSSGDATTPVYDIRLHPGMTKVDLEAIAGPAKGVPRTGPPGADVEYERVTVFFNLLH
ncbi:unnamed protein product [Penicillium olsonii]|uniref:Bromo domain-containing protein n=1 Tax=Penicillium olsonii TaxID=99116 RepID=A0A9W4MS87_PENOL|nr:unnamed protein product [Penicillium olsonii]CAG8115242.1 unnamed protein product [Penicillium olsonii]